MSTYIYRYKTKNHPWLYVGKSDRNLKGRINSHKKEDKFKPYLKDCSIFYFELDNPAQSKFVESYLIDKYKPLLNCVDKYEGVSPFSLNIPDWKPLKHYVREDNILPTLIENKTLLNKKNRDKEKIDELKEKIDELKFKIEDLKSEIEFYKKIYGNKNEQIEKWMNIVEIEQERNMTMMIHYNKMIRHYNELRERVNVLNGQNIILRNKIQLITQ